MKISTFFQSFILICTATLFAANTLTAQNTNIAEQKEIVAPDAKSEAVEKNTDTDAQKKWDNLGGNLRQRRYMLNFDNAAKGGGCQPKHTREPANSNRGATSVCLGVITDNTANWDNIGEKAQVSGLEIISVMVGSPAEKAGLKANDRLLSMNKKPINSYDELVSAISTYKSLDEITISFVRDGKTNSAAAKLGVWTTKEKNNDKEKTTTFTRARLGVATEDAEKGALLNEISTGTAAEKAGLQKGDVVFQIEKTDITSADALTQAVRSHRPDEKITIRFYRNGKTEKVTAKLGSQTVEKRRNHGYWGGEKRKCSCEDQAKSSVPEPIKPSLRINPENFTIVPNPAGDRATIKFVSESKLPLNVVVRDMAGKEIFAESVKDFSGNYEHQMDMVQQPDGIYLVEIRQDGNVFSQKMIHSKQ